MTQQRKHINDSPTTTQPPERILAHASSRTQKPSLKTRRLLFTQPTTQVDTRGESSIGKEKKKRVKRGKEKKGHYKSISRKEGGTRLEQNNQNNTVSPTRKKLDRFLLRSNDFERIKNQTKQVEEGGKTPCPIHCPEKFLTT